jgi:N-acylneuraminate cytidylyltransferase/CMP-N,N'-diacetyllegionaminic acid synthase
VKVLFIILARGGSKGLPNKNILLLLGKPLIAYSIECGLRSKYCTDLIVSTDDSKIADVAKLYGAKVPFSRPAYLSNDFAKSADAILHAIDFQEKIGMTYDLIVLLEPTSPLRDTQDIDDGIQKLLINQKAESCVSVTLNESAHPSFLFYKREDDIINSYMTQNNVIRRQELQKLYYPEGSFYIVKTEAFKKVHTFYIDHLTLGLELPKWKSFEIDTLEDFMIVEAIMNAKINNQFKDLNK